MLTTVLCNMNLDARWSYALHSRKHSRRHHKFYRQRLHEPNKKKVENLNFLSKKMKPKFSKELWRPKSQNGNSNSSPKTADWSLDYSDVLGFSGSGKRNDSPQFPWNSSTAHVAWKKYYIFVNISSICELGKEWF